MTPPPNSGDEPRKPDDDPLGGMDPMAWLESLARRQGANPDELVTGGNMEIPVPPAENADSDAAVEAALPGISPDESSALSAAPDSEASGALEDLTGGIDPMAWLESLARRQGASPDELITGGELDLPLPEPEVPAPEREPATDSFELMAESEIVDGNDPLAWLSEMAESGDELDELAAAMSESTAPAGASADDPLGGMDPMAWLESLARRQGASPDELVTGGSLDLPPEEEAESRPAEAPMIEYVDQRDLEMAEEVAAPDALAELGELAYEAEMESAPEPLATADVLDGNDPMAWLSELAEGGDLDAAAPETPEPAVADIPGGMDPMAWLESLARRQGASPDELVTGGTLELPPEAEAAALPELELTPESDFQLDFDSTLDEIEAEGEATTEPLFPLPSIPDELPDMAFSEETEAFQFAEAFEGERASMLPEEEEAAETTDAVALETADLAAGMDPMAWLESLARRQGASPDELVTGGTLDLPPEPDVQPAEPGYSEFDPFAVTTFGERAEYPETGEPEAEVTEEMSVLAEVDPLAWLETLTGTARIDLGSLESYVTPAAEPEDQTMAPESALSWLQSLTTEGMVEAAPSAQATPSVIEDEMAGGLSDDVEEIRAWLETQARHLEEAGIEPEAAPVDEGDTEPVPAEIPDWLTRMRPSSETASETPPLTDALELPELPSDLPGWLAAAEPGAELPDLEAELARLESADLATAFPSEPTRMPPELEVLTEPPSPDEIDSWAEALDEEFEREQAGDESIPDWYLEALQRAEAEIRGAPPPEIAEIAAPMESAEVAGIGESVEPVEPAEPLIEIVAESEAEMPSWLRAPIEDMTASEPVVDGSIPGWLGELALEVSPEPALSELAEPLAVEPQEIVTADEGRAEVPYPPIPAEEDVRPPWLQPVHEPVRRPAEPPAPVPAREWRDMPVALSQARQWVQQGQIQPALEQYQTLVDSAQLLEETRADLRTLAEQHPTEPKVFRLLGDTYMRLGDLQAALDTYLSALDQL